MGYSAMFGKLYLQADDKVVNIAGSQWLETASLHLKLKELQIDRNKDSQNRVEVVITHHTVFTEGAI